MASNHEMPRQRDSGTTNACRGWARRRSSDSASTDSSRNARPRKRNRADENIDPPTKPRLSHRDYTVGWVSALPLELAAAQALLDEEHESLASSPSDTNCYVLGRSGQFNIAIACLPSGATGLNNATTVSSNMLRTFTSIRLQLMVGIAGGAPSPENDVRLGDVVVGQSVVQYDHGKTGRDGQFESGGRICAPPTSIMSVVSALRAEHDIQGSRTPALLEKMLHRYPLMAKHATCDGLIDILFDIEYEHPASSSHEDCKGCDASRQVARLARSDRTPRVYYGTIGSGNRVVKHGTTREQLRHQYKLLCVEMEGAAFIGLDIPFLVVRGISDYADSHKNEQWQRYAASTAAAYTMELLSRLPAAMNETGIDGDLHRRLTLQDTGSSTMPSLRGEDNGVDDGKLQQILQSLEFDQIDARRSTIKSASARTCEWLLSNEQFKHWLDPAKSDDHHGLFWIKGKPGAGKSTLMKFVLDRFQKNEETTAISFFFNARGNDTEKSVLGMYRSLLLQILTQLPRMRHSLQLSATFATSGQGKSWTVPLLGNLLEQAVDHLGRDHLICFIDALDESQPDDIRRMVASFEDLAERAVRANKRFQVCFASRHYPYITVRKAIELVLDDQKGHEEDIAKYIKDKLRIGKSKSATLVNQQVQDKAAGIFMWVVLVVEMLNRQRDKGLRIAALLEELALIPQDLHRLFRDILRRDHENRERTLLCIQWVLFARRPLTPTETYLAVHSGMESEDMISSPWDADEIPADDVKVFILSASKGLAEITKGKHPTVQFIHESVNDFLLKEDGIKELLDEPGEQVRGRSHDRLKVCCLRYIDNIPTDSSISQHLEPTKENARILVERFPLLAYATDNILYHADQAQGLGITQHVLLDHFKTTTSKNWVRLHNLLEKHKIRRFDEDVSFLYVLGVGNLGSLIRLCPNTSECFILEKSRYGSPFIAALATESYDAVRAFIEMEKLDDASTVDRTRMTDDELRPGPYSAKMSGDFVHPKTRSTLVFCAEHGSRQIFEFAWRHLEAYAAERDNGKRTVMHFSCYPDHVEMLIERGADIEARDKHNETPLVSAAARGCPKVVNSLLLRGADIHVRDKDQRTPLIRAAAKGHQEVVNLLLAHGADIHARNQYQSTPLIRAAEEGHQEVVNLLLSHGAEIEAQDKDQSTPLILAAAKGHQEVVNLLLAHGADIHARNQYQSTSLILAAAKGHQEVVNLLLAHGADIHARNQYQSTPLIRAAEEGHQEVVNLLLSHGAEIEAQDKDQRTPLIRAAEEGHQEVVNLLLAHGAHDREVNGPMKTSLCRAAERGHEEVVRTLLQHATATYFKYSEACLAISLCEAARRAGPQVVKLLLESGAPVDGTRDADGSSPLHCAVGGRDEAIKIMQLLLDHGANVAAVDGQGRTPLHRTIDWGYRNIDAMELLLNHASPINAQDHNGRTPLSYASFWRLSHATKLLIDKGATIDSVDKKGRMPLHEAVIDGSGRKVNSRPDVVQILLDGGGHADPRDLEGRSPLSWLAQSLDFDRATARLLMMHGAMSDAPDNHGHTPLDYARMHKNGQDFSRAATEAEDAKRQSKP